MPACTFVSLPCAWCSITRMHSVGHPSAIALRLSPYRRRTLSTCRSEGCRTYRQASRSRGCGAILRVTASDILILPVHPYADHGSRRCPQQASNLAGGFGDDRIGDRQLHRDGRGGRQSQTGAVARPWRWPERRAGRRRSATRRWHCCPRPTATACARPRRCRKRRRASWSGFHRISLNPSSAFS